MKVLGTVSPDRRSEMTEMHCPGCGASKVTVDSYWPTYFCGSCDIAVEISQEGEVRASGTKTAESTEKLSFRKEDGR